MGPDVVDAVHFQLELIRRVANQGDDQAAAGITRSETPRLVTAVYGLLAGHEPAPSGWCPACRERRWRPRRLWPNLSCRVYQIVARALLDDTGAHRSTT
jgi:hypothetical protein